MKASRAGNSAAGSGTAGASAARGARLAALALGGVFCAFGFEKVRAPAEFLKALHGYAILPGGPPFLENASALALPWFELLCGALLIAGVWRRTAALALLGLLVAFTLAVLQRGLRIAGETGACICSVRFDCGCGSGPVPFCAKLIENSALMLLAVLAGLPSPTCARGRARRSARAR
ncbi:MAG: hypothetical protein Fur0037_12360 [Planctomycetota bacterium]